MNGGIVHPAGCRCPGCLPGQYVMKPAVPARRPKGSAYRKPAATRRPPARRGGNSGEGGGIFIGLCFLAAILFWPVAVWHGEGGPTGTDWQWDIRSTVALLVWWGILALLIGLYYVSHLPEPAAKQPPQPQIPPPVCLHRQAVRVESALDADKTLAWWCPDCETQLDPAFRSAGPAAVTSAASRPAAPAVSGLRWQWEWWCSCGAADAGYAAAEQTAQARARAVKRHVRRGCQWEMRWHAA